MDLLKEKILHVFGKPLQNTNDFKILSFEIFDKTKKYISVATLKRFFGRAVQRKHYYETLEILCLYAGFQCYDLYKSLDNNAYSDYSEMFIIRITQHNPGDMIKLTYKPDRRLVLMIMDDYNLRVVKSINSKLRDNDILVFDTIVINQPLIINIIYRNTHDIGSYIAGKEGGIISCEIINSEVVC